MYLCVNVGRWYTCIFFINLFRCLYKKYLIWPGILSESSGGKYILWLSFAWLFIFYVHNKVRQLYGIRVLIIVAKSGNTRSIFVDRNSTESSGAVLRRRQRGMKALTMIELKYRDYHGNKKCSSIIHMTLTITL